MPLLGGLLPDVAGADSFEGRRTERVADTAACSGSCGADGGMPAGVWSQYGTALFVDVVGTGDSFRY